MTHRLGLIDIALVDIEKRWLQGSLPRSYTPKVDLEESKVWGIKSSVKAKW